MFNALPETFILITSCRNETDC